MKELRSSQSLFEATEGKVLHKVKKKNSDPVWSKLRRSLTGLANFLSQILGLISCQKTGLMSVQPFSPLSRTQEGKDENVTLPELGS